MLGSRQIQFEPFHFHPPGKFSNDWRIQDDGAKALGMADWFVAVVVLGLPLLVS
jgi:hypothetical protein